MGVSSSGARSSVQQSRRSSSTRNVGTVKSLKMEPQVKGRYNDYLAEYLRSGFAVRQIANTYNVLANGLEQPSACWS